MKTVHQTDEDGILLYSGEVALQPHGGYSTPYLAVIVTPPACPAGRIARWRSDVEPLSPTFGQEGTGEWETVEDRRADSFYLTTDGGSYRLGSSTEAGLVYRGTGPVPGWLTETPRPSELHIWDGDGWQLDQEAADRQAAAVARIWRDAEIRRTDHLMMPDYPLVEESRQALQEYRQALRDWPTQSGFPLVESRPQPPSWL